jgi:hypothetical protein
MWKAAARGTKYPKALSNSNYSLAERTGNLPTVQFWDRSPVCTPVLVTSGKLWSRIVWAKMLEEREKSLGKRNQGLGDEVTAEAESAFRGTSRPDRL